MPNAVGSEPSAQPGTPAAALHQVDKAYGHGPGRTQVLAGFCLAVPRAAVTLIAGPSGCGKSTALRLLAGVDIPDRGTVVIAGTVVSHLRPAARRRIRAAQVSYLFQDPVANLVEDLTVLEQVTFAARLRGVDRRVEVLRRILGDLDLDQLADRYPRQLSGGQQQRAAIAAATIGSPALIIADEPTAELDAATGGTVLALLRELALGGRAVVLASHDPAARPLADVVCDMTPGIST